VKEKLCKRCGKAQEGNHERDGMYLCWCPDGGLTMVIDKFEDEFAFLSNFWPCLGTSVEHLYQAAKTTDVFSQLAILLASTPNEAKKLGRKVALRADWEQIKLAVMECLLRAKFKDPMLRAALLATGDAELIEGNWWHDNFWGSCSCRTRSCGNVGQNHLGRLLMKIKEEIRAGKA
jgi:ribA/ribD-fused uncharacterized protein